MAESDSTVKHKRKRRAQRGHQAGVEATRQISALLGDQPRQREYLIEYLHQIQDRWHGLSRDHMAALANELSLALTEVFETASFYHHFDILEQDEQAFPVTVRVCDSVSCELYGANKLLQQLQHGLADKTVRIQPVPCVGRCHQAPVAVVGQNPIAQATVATVTKAVEQKADQASIPADSINYRQYIENGGYSLLQACLQGKHQATAIIEKITASGLRGLGGAGFPAGRKWDLLRQQPAPRYIAINIDEGEPGTFKDRYYLEKDLHRFIEGSLIAAWAIDAAAIYIYLRDEYAGCRKLLLRELQLLQDDPPCKLPPIYLRRGAGAYICGEESAMIESIEGKRGMPRLRPPYVAEKGLFNRPTLEHNMETMHWVRDIVERGSDWFCNQGRHGRKGLRSFSVSGRVKNPGVHVAPAGITLNELIAEYCGGMEDGHTLYAWFPGGASGGILPASLADTPIDFDTLQPHGCFIGSAAIIILSEHDRVRDAALNAMRFFSHESCGQCTPCRVGTVKAVKLMEQDKWNKPLLMELAEAMADTSICGLGQAAPNPMLCAMRYFPEEFQ
ncbi:MAG: NADH-ubiquinone oxidoreductase-F iron-sulfur binding region domain-containing protein [Candidatus Porifericomitaceae bacterium WSBS_2022_MAG_OTU9]